MFLKSFWVGALGSILLATAACNIKVEKADGDTEGGAPSGNGSGGSSSTSGGARAAMGGADTAMGGAQVAMGGTSVGGASSSGGTGTASSGGAAPQVVEDCTGKVTKTRVDTAHAADLGAGATICLNRDGDDYFFVDTPKDKGAHVLKLVIAPDAGADAQFEAVAQSDASSMGRDFTTNGARTLWLALTGSTRTFLKFSPFSSGGRVVITPTWVPTQDSYEPNDTKDTAGAIQVNTDTNAQLQRSYSTAADTTCVDWYKMELAAGPHSFVLSHVPDDVRPQISVIGPSGENVKGDFGRNAGALFESAFTAATAGTYWLGITDFDGCPRSYYVGTTLDSMTDVYTFKVTE
ncbi:MAG TPA: hypothetical protein VFQ61_21190 [Polyangiaceae bacterium]|nr:hypothetical protein [Polyangiaceae bacterium]